MYKSTNKELKKSSNHSTYNYKKIKKYCKKNKKRNNRVLGCIDKVDRILDRENKHIVKQCKKQIHNKMKGKLENPHVYMNEINFKKNTNKLFNKNIKTGGGDIKKYDLTYIYAPYKNILTNDYNTINNELKNDDIINYKKIFSNYYCEVFLHIFLIAILIYLLYYIYYYNLFNI